MFPRRLRDTKPEQRVQLLSAESHSLSNDVPGSVLARFFQLRGRRIVKACGALWYAVPGRFLMSLPYQSMLNPNPVELRAMILDAGVFGARFPSLKWTGIASGLYVLRQRPYNLASLHIKHRPRVRHAQQCFEMRRAEKHELLAQGLVVNLDTMSRQGRFDSEFGQPKRWEKLVEAIFACPEISCPAVFCGHRLAAYMVTCRERNWLHILHQMSRQEDLPNFPNHLLTYTVSFQATADDSLEAVCYGCAPLFAADGLHEYKLRFGYEVVPNRSAIQLHPFLSPFASWKSASCSVRLARRWLPANQRIETLETVLEGARASGPA